MGERAAVEVVVFPPTENGADEGAHIMVVGFGAEPWWGEGGAEGFKDTDEDPDVAMDDGGGEVVTVGVDEVQEVGEEGFAVVMVEVRWDGWGGLGGRYGGALGGGLSGFGAGGGSRADEGFEVGRETAAEFR